MMGIFSIRDLFGDKMVSQTVWDGTTVSSEGKRERKVIVYERLAGLSRCRRGMHLDVTAHRERCSLSTTIQSSTPLDTLVRWW